MKKTEKAIKETLETIITKQFKSKDLRKFYLSNLIIHLEEEIVKMEKFEKAKSGVLKSMKVSNVKK